MKKLIGFIIILTLILITPFSVLSEVNNSLSQSETQSLAEQTTASANDNAIELMAANTSIVNEAVYTIRNAASGKYVNVHNGIDATGTNVYQWTADGSAEQKFKIVYSSADDAYKFYCMCSSNGTYRVLDIKRDNAAVASGQNVQICGPVDPTAQNWTIVSLGSGQYKICVKANTSLALTSYGTSNGTSTGTSPTSAGNVFISTYTGSPNQIWYIEQDSASAATPHGWLDSVTSTKISGWAWRSDIPNTSIFVHLYLTNTTTNQVYVRNAGLASIYRADLESAGIGNGRHGFSYSINWQDYPPGVYNVKAYAIGANGNNPQLMGSPKSYNNILEETHSNSVSAGCQWLVPLDGGVVAGVGYTLYSNCYVKTASLTNRTAIEVSSFAQTDKNPNPEINLPTITIGNTYINNTLLQMSDYTNVWASPDWIWKCGIFYPNTVVPDNSSFSGIAICMLNGALYPYQDVTNTFSF